METIRGRTSHILDLTELRARLADYNRITMDLGTGDGKFAFHHAQAFPHHFVIGVDSCRENLREHSRAKLPNLLFLIASAQSLPHELSGLVSHITINFPWGSLLESLLTSDSRLLCGLESALGGAGRLEVRLNGGALAEAGWGLEDGAERVRFSLESAGWQISSSAMMDSRSLKNFPSTWANRLAFGRDPRAILLQGCL
ncbi:MAG TPA: class I SAM-dependent methyltransferase [Anaerolineales bacterium]|nr:class I SAM-dependent methyltransferase [Anaerolineales bacterium]